jgi:hypothetical protein
MTDHPKDGEVTLRLTENVAVVLFDLLSRWSDPAGLTATPSGACFESAAECAALHDVLTNLEAQLVAPFEADYREKVSRARQQLAGRWNGSDLRA